MAVGEAVACTTPSTTWSLRRGGAGHAEPTAQSLARLLHLPGVLTLDGNRPLRLYGGTCQTLRPPDDQPALPQLSRLRSPFIQMPDFVITTACTRIRTNEPGSVCNLNCRLPAGRPVITVIYTKTRSLFLSKE